MFKKIFDLDPKEVEKFVIEQFKDAWIRNGHKFPKDMIPKVQWCVPEGEFYVFTEPKMDTKDWKKYKFRGKKVTLKKYFDIISDHQHFYFSEIYAQMTGETTFLYKLGLVYADQQERDKSDIDTMYIFYYNKEYTTVCHKKDDTWFIQEWEKGDPDDDALDLEIRKPVPEDLLKEVLKVYNA
jgi:hypothetical protein